MTIATRLLLSPPPSLSSSPPPLLPPSPPLSPPLPLLFSPSSPPSPSPERDGRNDISPTVRVKNKKRT